MAWSIFTQGGGPGAARSWAIDLLRKIGAPTTLANQQFVYDWEVSEGGGGAYNPLNQGPVPGSPGLTTTGSQYGGGAADFASWAAGLQGAADYLAMPSFVGIRDALRNDQAATARADLIASPWAASHYGGGSAFSSEALPGHASALGPLGSADAGSSASSGGGGILGIPGAISSVGTDLKTVAIVGPLVIAGAAVIVWGLARASGTKEHIEGGAEKAAAVGAMAA